MDEGTARDLTVRVRILEEELLGLRLALHRTAAAALLVAMLLGLVLPIFTDDDTGPVTTLGAWYVALVDPGAQGDGLSVVLGVGFVGLLAAALVVAGQLFLHALGTWEDRPWLRGWASALTVVGSLVPAFLSLVSHTADAQDSGSEPGWGGVVLLVAAVAAAVLLNRAGTRELGRSLRR